MSKREFDPFVPDLDGVARQKPLSLKFDEKPFWNELCAEFGVNQTGAAIILDICESGDFVSYSRTARHYDRPRRYRNHLYTFGKIVAQVDRLDEMGLIDHDRQLPGGRGWQSALRAKPELVQACRRITEGRGLSLVNPSELIWVRDENRRLVDYRDTQMLERARRRVAAINEAIAGLDLDPTIASPLVRIFNRSFKRGGRFFAMGSSWQNIKREARKYVSIAGEPVVELDYKTLHPAILYSWVGSPMPSDCYTIDGWPRSLVKVALLILINAETKRKAVGALMHQEAMDLVAPRGSPAAQLAARNLFNAIRELHRPIEQFFASGVGAELMNVDAQIAETVMGNLLRRGIVALPVHDSFLVQSSKAGELEAAMMDAAHKFGLMAIQIEAK